MDLDLLSPTDLAALQQQAEIHAGYFGAEPHIQAEYNAIAHSAWVLKDKVPPPVEPPPYGGAVPNPEWGFVEGEGGEVGGPGESE